MKRLSIILAVLLSSLLVTGVTLASPLTDYSQGKTAIDVNWMPSLDMEASGDLGSISGDGKNGNFDFGITTGLGGKWAIQYRYFSPTTKDYDVFGYGLHAGIRTQEANILYQVDKHMSVFAGWHQARITSNVPSPLDCVGYIGYPTKNSAQIGLVGYTEIAPKTNLYGVVGFGKDLFNGEAGVAYQLAKDFDFNLFYRYKKLDNLKITSSELGSANTDVTTKGFGLGLTYKF